MKFGKAFSDNVMIERERRGLFSTADPSWWYGAGRPLLFASCILVAFFILTWRLFTLTIINGHAYRLLSDSNRTKQLIVHAPRGALLDRTGKTLAANIPYFRLLKPCDEDRKTLCTSRISKEEGEAFKVKGLPAGWFLETDYQRTYTISEALSHVLGYMGQVSEKELQDEYYTLRGYRIGDMIGRMGAEEVFEEKLRGKDGKELVEVDAKGSILRMLGQTSEVAGTSITLSLDKGLSETVEAAFPKGEKGAVVVTKPSTGEIVALFSSPSFPLEMFTRMMSSEEFEKLSTDVNQPLFNRAIAGVYPPGSTFKPMIALAALEEKVIKKDTVVEDTGEIKIGLFTFPNWYFKQYGKTEGMVDVVKALQRSNDIFFYKTGEWLGITKLSLWAQKLGIGKPLGIELPGEASGLMPDPAWKNERFSSEEDKKARNNEWYLGDTYHVAIGQGYLLTTPLQLNSWTNVIANGGKLCRPTVLKSENGGRLPAGKAGKTENCKDLEIQKETIQLITEGMEKACEPGGTGYPLFNFGIRRQKAEDLPAGRQAEQQIASTSGEFVRIPVACKTGTAEFGLTTGSGNLKTHAWFTAFAPLPGDKDSGNLSSDSRNQILTGEPEISVTVLIEGAGEGSDKAAPVAKKIFEKWFSR